MRRWQLRKIARGVSIVTICMMLGILGHLGLVENRKVVKTRELAEISCITEYCYQEIKDNDTPLGCKTEYSWILQDTSESNICLAFCISHHYVKVSIDEDVLYELMPSKNKLPIKTIGSNWVIVPLYEEDIGKQICITLIPVYENYKQKQLDLFVGSLHEIFIRQLMCDLPQLLLSLMVIAIGIGFILIAIYNIKNNKQTKELIELGIFSIMMGLWRFTDNNTLSFLLPEYTACLFYISIGMLMLATIPFVKSVQNRYSQKVYIAFEMCCIITCIVCNVQMLLQIFGIADFRENLWITHVMIFFNSMVILFGNIYEKWKFKKKSNLYMGKTFVVICILGILIDLCLYYNNHSSANLIVTLVFFSLYVSYTGIFMLCENSQWEKYFLQQEKKMLLSQIQPHFLINSLIVIKSLCKKDVQEAIKALEHFTAYLKISMNSLCDDKCISFEKELEHIQNYLYLEQKRFGEKLQIVYDIQEKEFCIPTLSVQPIVDNAVRHGIRKKIEGGSIYISTFKEKQYYVVRIADNGLGFDISCLDDTQYKCSGIMNIKSYLKVMCNGTLEINSIVGEGTEVFIKVPSNKML